MSTKKAATSGQKDTYDVVNSIILEQLEKGIVPWRLNWHQAGPPTNLISKQPYKGVNTTLLAIAGYDTNYFLTEKQLGTIGGTIRPGERPHVIAYWNNGEDDKKKGRLDYYKVFNIAQCSGIPSELVVPFTIAENPLAFCEHIVSVIPHLPEIKQNEPQPYYDPILDVINIPKVSNKNKQGYYTVLLHELAHSTGHHTRLDRIGLIQMREVGYSGCSLEELVAEITAGQLYSMTGLGVTEMVSWPTARDWYEELSKSKYLIFTAYTLSLKALDYMLDKQAEAESVAFVAE